MTKKTDKQILFERMGTVGGMPLKEELDIRSDDFNGDSNGHTVITKEKNPKEFNELKNILGLEKMGSHMELPNGGSVMNQGDFQITFSNKEFLNREYPDPPQAGSAPDERGMNERNDTINTGNPQLPPELSNSEYANIIMAKINELLDLLNDPDIDQSEGGVSDRMREMALHMINANR